MKRWIYSLLLLVLLAGLAGCQRRSGDGGDTEGVYQIYYMNSSMTRLEPQDYTMPQMPADGTATETDWKITQLMEQLRNVPKDLDRQSAVPDKVGFERYKLEDTVLYLYFDNNYAMMNPTREILCRAALVRTLTQAEGVDYVAIYTAEQPLMDSTGVPVGAMTGADFIDNISNVNAFEKTELTLYFANEEKDGLVAEKREVFHSMNTSLERLVVEQLLAGSQNGGLSVMPKNTKVLNVSLTDNTCYVNLDSGFISGDIDVAEYIPIYAIVDSLTELQTVNKVQITVNGSADVTYRNVISLVQPLEREEKYIVK